jgi:hypothetical protein
MIHKLFYYTKFNKHRILSADFDFYIYWLSEKIVENELKIEFPSIGSELLENF